MKRFTIYDLRFTRRGVIAGVVLSLFAPVAMAAPVRVTTWNIEPNLAAGAYGSSPEYRKNLIRESAEILKQLHPDVIMLQGVPDWESCSNIVTGLKPARYNLTAWSSFRDSKTGTLTRRQVAILSKTRAYISWSEAWKSNAAAATGGFAFAAIRIGGKNAGFFSVQLGSNELLGEEGHGTAQQSAREESARQLLAQIASLKNWTTNRVQPLAVAGAFDTNPDEPSLAREKTLPLLCQAGFANAFGDMPPVKRITLSDGGSHFAATADYIFTRDASTAAPPEILPTVLTEHYPVTCELDLNPSPAPQPSAIPVQVAESPAIKPPETRTDTATTNPVSAAPIASATQSSPRTAATIPAPPEKESLDRRRVAEIAGIASGGILLLAVVWRLARPRRGKSKRTGLLTMKAGDTLGSGSSSVMSERIVIAPRHAETAGSAADHPPIVHIESPDAAAQARIWQRRAEEADRRAERATELAKQGLMGHLAEWLKGRLVQRLASDRALLMDTQNAASQKMQIVDERLSKIENQLQSRYRAYEQRITELEMELAEAREENRELIRAKIAQVRAQMEKERAEAQRASGNLP